jgi:hypothetical protein
MCRAADRAPDAALGIVNRSIRVTEASMAAYPVEDELPHAAGEPPFWQESVVIFWWDDEAGVGGFQRIGHEPYFQGGTIHQWSFVFLIDGRRFRNHGSVPAPLESRSRRHFPFDAQNEMLFNGKPVWHIGGSGIDIALTVENFYNAQDSWPRNSGTLSSQVARGHTECAGRARGQASVQGHAVAINALCSRDHSWGPRDWSKLRDHIWFSGTCGRDFNFSGINFFATDGTGVRNATLFRDGEHNNQVKFEVTHDGDATTGKLGGGTIVMHPPGGKPCVLRFECVDGGCTLHHGYLLFDYICRVRSEDGHSGYLAFEWARRHDLPRIPAEVSLTVENGWTRQPIFSPRSR